MLSHFSVLLLAAALLIAMDPIETTNEELDCSIEASLSITSKLIDSALREMSIDIKEHLSRHNQCETKPMSCSECLKTSPESKPTNCSDCQKDCIGFCSSTSEVKLIDCSEVKPIDCSDVYRHGNHTNGKYIIWPQSWITNESLLVYCDMETDGGGWTVIQRRGDFGNPSDFFYRDWNEYKTGFGDLEKEFWIGNDNLFALTSQRSYQIRFDLWDWDDNFKYAIYNTFRVDDEFHFYKLHVKEYNGTAGDSFSYHDEMNFSTEDKDYDPYVGHCAVLYKGAWWYNKCHYSNLNGLYSKARSTDDGKQLSWYAFFNNKYFPLKVSNMKIRPVRS